ncbi:Protein ENHANCED DISEASE RESISTANCE 2-like [Linum perenne]
MSGEGWELDGYDSNGSGGRRSRSSSSSGVGDGEEKEKERGVDEYFGWVYHLGTSSIGYVYCYLRFLFIRGKIVEMYKRDPHQHPGIRPIRRGIVGPTFMVEDLGCRSVYRGDVYVLRFYNRLDEAKKGEIACASAEEARKWMEAFDRAKLQVETSLLEGSSSRNRLNVENEINLGAHRHGVRRYATGLKRLISVGKGPEKLLQQVSNLDPKVRTDVDFEDESGDAVETHEWKCVRTINGVRIFEDVSDCKNVKGVLVKAVGVIDASADTVFEVFRNTDRHQRYEWDTLTGDLELLDSYDGNYDVVYGTFNPKTMSRWRSNRDFVYSRQWFYEDGIYTILQFPAVHKMRPLRSGFRRKKINSSTWEIRRLNTPMGSTTAKCVVTEMLEIHQAGWNRWKQNLSSKFERTIPYALLSQVAGLKEYIGANPALCPVLRSSISYVSDTSSDQDIEEVEDEFFDANNGESSSSGEESDNDSKPVNKVFVARVKLKNVFWAVRFTNMAKNVGSIENRELDHSAPPMCVDPSQFYCTMRQGKDKGCWESPSNTGFLVRGRTYLQDKIKVMGGDPLFKLIAADWFRSEQPVEWFGLHPKCLLQTEPGKKLPFVFVFNLQIPAKPCHSLILYFAADRPLKAGSLLDKFANGTDAFRNSRFKLIPNIEVGYWLVKRAVGNKACILSKTVSCKYLRQDNFLEMDADIGSSAIARKVIGMSFGCTSFVADLAVVIEGQDEMELPEFVLGTVRLHHLGPEYSVPPGT